MSSEQREAMEMAEDREDELLSRLHIPCICPAIRWWVLHLANGTRAPYTAEGLNHFATCIKAKEFRRGK